MQLNTCVRVSVDWMGICERARTRMAGLSSSVHSITLIGFIRELKPNTSSVCCLRLPVIVLRPCVSVCDCVYTHLRWTFNTHWHPDMMFAKKHTWTDGQIYCSSIRGIIFPSVTYLGMDFFFSLLFFSKLTSPMRRHCWSGGCSFTDLRQEEKNVRCCNTTFDPI